MKPWIEASLVTSGIEAPLVSAADLDVVDCISGGDRKESIDEPSSSTSIIVMPSLIVAETKESKDSTTLAFVLSRLEVSVCALDAAASIASFVNFGVLAISFIESNLSLL